MSDNDPNSYKFPSRINEPVMIYVFPAIQFFPTLLSIMIPALYGDMGKGALLGTLTFFTIGWLMNNTYIDVYYHKLWRLGIFDYAFGTKVNPMIKKYHG